MYVNQKAQDNKEKRTFKQRLTDNKIYFETIVSVTLTIMGIIISVVTLLQGCQANVNEEILNQPLFNVFEYDVNGPITIDGIEFSVDNAVEYRIYNQGGELTSGQASGFRMLTVSLWNAEFENVAEVDFIVNDTFISAGARYNPVEKLFTIYRDNKDFETGKMVGQIEILLEEEYPCQTEIFWNDYAYVSYSDYKGNNHRVLLDLYNGISMSDNNIEPDGYLPDFYSDDVESVYDTIRTKINLVLDSCDE